MTIARTHLKARVCFWVGSGMTSSAASVQVICTIDESQPKEQKEEESYLRVWSQINKNNKHINF